jgi:hypothetical protein
VATTFDVKTQGVDQLVNRLMGFEKDAYRALKTDIKSAADLIGASARSLLPGDYVVSGWGPWGAGQKDYLGSWASSSVKPGFRTRQIGRQRYVMGVVRMTNPGAVTYALLGNKDNSRLASEVAGRWGASYPRAMGPAWHLHVDKAREAIQDAVNAAAAKVG